MKHYYLALVALSGCVASPDNQSSGLTVYPNTTLYSGVETGTGAIPYKLTIAASGASGVTWTSSAPATASVSGTDALGTVTSLATGSAMITVKSADASFPVPVTIVTYKASDRAGASGMWTSTCAASGCHDANGIDVSPSDIGKHTDAEVQAAVLSGQNPEGGDISIGAAAHSFGNAPMPGIIAYMRSLPPGTPHADN